MGSILLSRGECRRLNSAGNKVEALRRELRAATDEMTDLGVSETRAICALVEYRRVKPLHTSADLAALRLRQSLSKKIHERSVTTCAELSEMDLSGLTHRELGALLRPWERSARALAALMMKRWQNYELLTLVRIAAERELAGRRAEKKAAWEGAR